MRKDYIINEIFCIKNFLKKIMEAIDNHVTL